MQQLNITLLLPQRVGKFSPGDPIEVNEKGTWVHINIELAKKSETYLPMLMGLSICENTIMIQENEKDVSSDN